MLLGTEKIVFVVSNTHECVAKGDIVTPFAVAPLVGAWIETLPSNPLHDEADVAPLVGAWIETDNLGQKKRTLASRPSWARGLKLYPLSLKPAALQSRPSWARGLKQSTLEVILKHLGRAPRGRVD